MSGHEQSVGKALSDSKQMCKNVNSETQIWQKCFWKKGIFQSMKITDFDVDELEFHLEALDLNTSYLSASITSAEHLISYFVHGYNVESDVVAYFVSYVLHENASNRPTCQLKRRNRKGKKEGDSVTGLKTVKSKIKKGTSDGGFGSVDAEACNLTKSRKSYTEDLLQRLFMGLFTLAFESSVEDHGVGITADQSNVWKQRLELQVLAFVWLILYQKRLKDVTLMYTVGVDVETIGFIFGSCLMIEAFQDVLLRSQRSFSFQRRSNQNLERSQWVVLEAVLKKQSTLASKVFAISLEQYVSGMQVLNEGDAGEPLFSFLESQQTVSSGSLVAAERRHGEKQDPGSLWLRKLNVADLYLVCLLSFLECFDEGISLSSWITESKTDSEASEQPVDKIDQAAECHASKQKARASKSLKTTSTSKFHEQVLIVQNRIASSFFPQLYSDLSFLLLWFQNTLVSSSAPGARLLNSERPLQKETEARCPRLILSWRVATMLNVFGKTIRANEKAKKSLTRLFLKERQLSGAVGDRFPARRSLSPSCTLSRLFDLVNEAHEKLLRCCSSTVKGSDAETSSSNSQQLCETDIAVHADLCFVFGKLLVDLSNRNQSFHAVLDEPCFLIILEMLVRNFKIKGFELRKGPKRDAVKSILKSVVYEFSVVLLSLLANCLEISAEKRNLFYLLDVSSLSSPTSKKKNGGAIRLLIRLLVKCLPSEVYIALRTKMTSTKSFTGEENGTEDTPLVEAEMNEQNLVICAHCSLVLACCLQKNDRMKSMIQNLLPGKSFKAMELSLMGYKQLLQLKEGKGGCQQSPSTHGEEVKTLEENIDVILETLKVSPIELQSLRKVEASVKRAKKEAQRKRQPQNYNNIDEQETNHFDIPQLPTSKKQKHVELHQPNLSLSKASPKLILSPKSSRMKSQRRRFPKERRKQKQKQKQGEASPVKTSLFDAEDLFS